MNPVNPILNPQMMNELELEADVLANDDKLEYDAPVSASVREAANSNAVPEELQGIITQTDEYGNPLNSAARSDESPIRKTLFRRFCCCFSRNSVISHANQNQGSLSRQRSKIGVITSMRSRPLLLGPQSTEHKGKKCLALDLDETLVHSSFQPVRAADYIIPVQIEGTIHNVYVLKRPGVDEFIKRVAEFYEVVIYTASLGKYADPLLDKLDLEHYIAHRFFREDCVYHDGHFVKDLSLLNRDIATTIIVDNSPMSYVFHPENAIDCSSFIDSKLDRELWQIADFLIANKDVDNVRLVCRTWRDWCRKNASSTSVPP